MAFATLLRGIRLLPGKTGKWDFVTIGSYRREQRKRAFQADSISETYT